jgi:hypothetical protein
MWMFGVGRLWGYDTNNSPIEFGALQNVGLDFNADLKMLHGANRYPLVVAAGKGKIEAKASFAKITPDAINLVLQGEKTVGQMKVTTHSASIPAATTYDITVTNGASFEKNLGVINVSNPLVAVPMTISAGETPAAGEYKYDPDTGKYTFAAADASKDVQITYMYSDDTTGTTLTLGNPEMGTAPQFSVLLNTKLNGIELTVWLAACVSTKLSMALKQEDFLIPDFDIGAFAGSNGSPGWISLGE